MKSDLNQIDPALPAALVEAMEQGDLSEEQLWEIVAFEATQLGLRPDEAIELAQDNRLPATPFGFDLQFHVFLLLS